MTLTRNKDKQTTGNVEYWLAEEKMDKDRIARICKNEKPIEEDRPIHGSEAGNHQQKFKKTDNSLY